MLWYEDEVRQLEANVRSLTLDSKHRGKPQVVFYGSSSVRLWTTLAQDFPETNLLNLGFGGSTLAACAWFFERLVVPVAPKSIVFYAGDNDLGDGRHPEEVFLFFCAFAEKARQLLPNTSLTYLSIKISPSRWNIAGPIRYANKLIADEIKQLPNWRMIDMTSPLLGVDGRPRRELFENDGLHLNKSGYKVWQQVLEGRTEIF
ncbi:GDSL-type esterase/lipase family protein [Spirosoma soli]|uniref:GDSL-type esterase/lipase family protein n=2 Tax=Spirosoma soli TaxID=1770529 RepID=A0ABW5LYF4_9BACT